MGCQARWHVANGYDLHYYSYLWANQEVVLGNKNGIYGEQQRQVRKSPCLYINKVFVVSFSFQAFKVIVGLFGFNKWSVQIVSYKMLVSNMAQWVGIGLRVLCCLIGRTTSVRRSRCFHPMNF